MPLVAEQLINWDYALNTKNDQLTRALKVIETLKKKKGGKPAEILINEEFVVQVASNPYISAKDTVMISEKGKDDKKTSKGSLSDFSS